MRTAIFALFCLAAVFAGDFTYEDGVVVLTESNFQDALNEFDYALVEFYAPWCGHCKKLAPEYAAAAQQLARTNPEVKLCKVDATVERELGNKYEVRGYPTLKFFAKGSSPIPYEGGRSAPEIVSWLKKKTGPASVQVNTVEDVEKLIGDNEVLVVFYGAAGSAAFTTYISVAAGFDDVAFAHTDDAAIKEKYEVTGDTIVLFKKFDEGKNVFTGPFNAASVRDFINNNRFPTILPFDQKSAQKIFGEGHDALFVIVGSNEAGNHATEALKAASAQLKGKILLSLAHIDEGLGGRLADYIGVTRESLPAVRIVQPGNNMQKFVFENEVTAENLVAFYNDFTNKKLTPYFKSEPIPANPLEDGVRIVVGKNFKEVVLDSEDDVLMEYYAPWCGHCKSLAPIYSSLATKLKDVKGLVIGKMDATANEVEGLAVQGFPTLKFYPKGNKSNPVDYNGERTEEAFLEYLKQHSSANFGTAATKSVDDEL